ncbi:putative enhancer of polycomb-like protein 1 [Calycina marina]|uniref:Enhancer of polycomb-like protein n=1 Tax=Calycina marina TaxID=1763456 RepID=A0A9P8CJT2_9HELO|nr:putative enhancer of polycomb-like protein 1 [Calycina marina]
MKRAQQPARVARVKKLSRSQGQQILREEEIDSREYEDLFQQQVNKITSGVEAAEETEIHLQAALAAATSGANEGEIPAPPADETPGNHYNILYQRSFDNPVSYIRFSNTVEDCTGCGYDMTSEDDVFLKEYNKKKSGGRYSEDFFEKIMAMFEETAKTHAPYASVDNTVVPFDTMKSVLVDRVRGEVGEFAKAFYDHWVIRQQLQPALKYETSKDNEDADPYVCFRRRDGRQTRKTRARDNASVDRLKKLRREMEDARGMVLATHQREIMKRDLLRTERMIFGQRAILKDTKVRLSIKSNDDDLINQKPQKRPRQSDVPARAPVVGRLPNGSIGPIAPELPQLSDIQTEKENALQRIIETKTQLHRKWNEDHIDLTREPLSPVEDRGPEPSFRPATAQYRYLTPPSSVNSEAFEQNALIQKEAEGTINRYSSPPVEIELQAQRAYRKRVGRLGRLWIDRRNMAPTPLNDNDVIMTDRWKYDQEDDDEQDVYPMDPYDITALRYRSTLPTRSERSAARPSPNDRLTAAALQPPAT